MSIEYDNIVPWGRSFEEYVQMFTLTEDDLAKRVLGVGDGPAGFNSAMHAQGRSAVSADPIYCFTAEQISGKIDEKYDEILKKTDAHRDMFVWTTFASVEELGNTRMRAMKEFLADYEQGLREQRYIHAELPVLPFEDNAFDLVLCAHLLFFYSDNLSTEFHLQSVREMLRLAPEVRIFPIIDLNTNISRHLQKTCDELAADGVTIEEVKVPYEFQKGGNTMVRFVR